VPSALVILHPIFRSPANREEAAGRKGRDRRALPVGPFARASGFGGASSDPRCISKQVDISYHMLGNSKKRRLGRTLDRTAAALRSRGLR
jgi:hypothetical protein